MDAQEIQDKIEADIEGRISYYRKEWDVGTVEFVQALTNVLDRQITIYKAETKSDV